MSNKNFSEAQMTEFRGSINPGQRNYPRKETTSEAAMREDKRRKIDLINDKRTMKRELADEWDLP